MSLGLWLLPGMKHRELHRQSTRDVGSFLLLQERNELPETGFIFDEFKSQTAAQFEVIVHSLTQRIHWAPPGHERANGRKAVSSTLA